MGIQLELETSFEPNTLPLPAHRNWDLWLARWVSRLFSPPLLGLIGALLLAVWLPSLSGWLSVYLLLALVLPVGYTIYLVRVGLLSDFHMQIREQRIRPMTFTLVCGAVAWGTLTLGRAPRLLMVFSLASALQTAFLLLVTLRWKISGHATATASLATLLWMLWGGTAVYALAFIPLVAWARVRLNRHSVMQTIGGSLAGMIFMAGALRLLAL